MTLLLEHPAIDAPAHAELQAAHVRIAELEAELRRARQDALPPFTDMRLLEVEGWLVRHAMDRAKGNVSRAARALGLSRAALYRRLERHGLGEGERVKA
jgi:transcriptional regulator of acetoin/glycerol metabolism